MPDSQLIIKVLLLTLAISVAAVGQEECTIGVAAGKATPDERPLIWKTRDTSTQDNEVKYNSSYLYNFISVTNAGATYAWMGVNELGFAIVNSVSSDLPGSTNSSGPSNGEVMRNCLGSCATVADFENYLISTNTSGRNTKSNFGVIDSTGAAAIFETSGYEYWKFDANDTNVTRAGYIVRTNFAMTVGINSGTYSRERYYRSSDLMSAFYAGDSLTYRSILRRQMRDFSDGQSNPITIPFDDDWYPSYRWGYIYTYVSICRSTSVASMVVQGVLPEGEPGYLSTMWTILGQPATGIAVPYWPVGNTPTVADGSSTAALCNVALDIEDYLYDWSGYTDYLDSYKLLDGTGSGLWTHTFPREDINFARTDSALAVWRATPPAATAMLALETELANASLTTLNAGLTYLESLSTVDTDVPQPVQFAVGQNYPNPFNAATVIPFYQAVPGFVSVKIYDLAGRQITGLMNDFKPAGHHSLQWNSGNLASGIYFYTIEFMAGADARPEYAETRKLTIIK